MESFLPINICVNNVKGIFENYSLTVSNNLFRILYKIIE